MATAKSYVSEFTLSLAPISLIGSLKTLRKAGADKDTAFKTICPECTDPSPMKQSYGCAEGHGPYTVGECDKAKDVDGTLVRVDANAAKEAKSSTLPENFLDVTVHPREQVEAATQPGGNAYIFVPKHVTQQYGVLADLLRDQNEYAFVGLCNIRKAEHFVRLNRFGDLVVIQQLLYPEDLNPVEPVKIEYSPEFLEAMNEFVTRSLKEFDPASYKNKARDRVKALAAATASGAPIPKAPAKITEDDLALDKLKALLAQ